MSFNPIARVTISKRACPPKTWAWLETCIRDHAPDYIDLIEGSSLHVELRNRAWDELHPTCLNQLGPKEQMLRNALLVTIRKSNRFKPCWAVARDLFAIGSTAASKLCRELGIEPDKLAGEVPQ